MIENKPERNLSVGEIDLGHLISSRTHYERPDWSTC
jgi:hypothetical protein